MSKTSIKKLENEVFRLAKDILASEKYGVSCMFADTYLKMAIFKGDECVCSIFFNTDYFSVHELNDLFSVLDTLDIKYSKFMEKIHEKFLNRKEYDVYIEL